MEEKGAVNLNYYKYHNISCNTEITRKIFIFIRMEVGYIREAPYSSMRGCLIDTFKCQHSPFAGDTCVKTICPDHIETYVVKIKIVKRETKIFIKNQTDETTICTISILKFC